MVDDLDYLAKELGLDDDYGLGEDTDALFAISRNEIHRADDDGTR